MASISALVDIVNTDNVSTALADQLAELVKQAVSLWANVLAGPPSVWRIRLEITAAGVPSGTANAASASSVAVGSIDNSPNAFEGVLSAELRSGSNLNGSNYDINIRVHSGYLANELWLDTTPDTASDIPSGKTDALSVMVHELGHALGFNGSFNDATNTFTGNAKSPYDYRLVIDGENESFSGPNTMAVFGGLVPTTNNNNSHYGNVSGPPSAGLIYGLMNGVVFYRGARYSISDLDLAFLADMGLGTTRDDIFDQQWFPQLWGGAGVDLFRANYSATTTAITFTGGTSVVQAPSTTLNDIERFDIVFGQAADTIKGGTFDDRLAGGGGADVLTGGGGSDTFVIRAASDISGAGDRITDFSGTFATPDTITGGGDFLDFSALNSTTFIGANAFTNIAGQVRYTFVGVDTHLQFDFNGDSVVDGLVTLAGAHFTLGETTTGSRILSVTATMATDDYAHTVATTGVLMMGGQAIGNIETVGDRDWFKITVTHTGRHSFVVKSVEGEHGTLGDAGLKFYDANGTFLYSGSAVASSWIRTNSNAIWSGYFFPLGTYYVEVTGDKNTTGTYVLSATDTDAGRPLLLSTSPSQSTTNVSPTPRIVLTFNEDIYRGYGILTLVRASDQAAVDMGFVWSGKNIEVIDNKLIYTPSTPLTPGVEYYILGSEGLVYDGHQKYYNYVHNTKITTFTVQAPSAAWSLDIPGGKALYGQSLDDNITGTSGDDFIGGARFNDTLNGGAGMDRMYGEDGDDTLNGGAEDDVLSGGAGNDVLHGEAGFDTLIGGRGDDLLLGGGDLDVVSYQYATSGVTVSLAHEYAQDVGGGEGKDTLNSIEGLIGSAFNDVLTGDQLDNLFEGGGGNDRIDGSLGTDTANYRSSSDGVTVDLRIAGAQFVSASQGSDTLIGIEFLTGSHFNDVLRGDSADNFLQGRLGNDTFSGGGGTDRIYGGQGEDTVEFTGASTDYLIGTGYNNQPIRFVRDQRPGSPDGLVLIYGIELLKFTDKTIRDAATTSHTLQFASAPNGVGEVDAGLSAWIGTLTRSGDLSEGASYKWEVRGVGSNPALPSDFMGQVLPSGILGFGANGSSATLVIPIIGNLVDGGNRTFEVAITTPDGPLVQRVTLYEDDMGVPDIPPPGAPGPDHMFGGKRDDVLEGAGGDDVLNGGAGLDTSVYASAKANYAWWQATDGSWRVQDVRTGAPEGLDTLVSIEKLKFSDGIVSLIPDTPSEILTTAFANVLRVALPTGADATYLSGLIAAVQSGTKVLSDAYDEIVRRADGSTAVAAMTYQFFLGYVPSKGGFEYLVSPTGPNANNINSAYYQFFSTENRYINFAVNVGSAGDGKAAFQAEYGALTLRQATAKAYQEIFGGAAPNEAFLSVLLDASVGGGMTRKDYFAYYGKDGPDGLGTKAAMVGWLLTEAAKADLGVLARSSNAYLTDLADGAAYLVDIVGVYGQSGWAHNPPG